MAHTIAFYVFAALTLFAALRMVGATNLFHGAMWLIGVLFGVAALYLLIDAQFLSAVQVTIYVGGIVVLIVFAILLVSEIDAKDRFASSAALKLGVGVVAAVLCGLIVYATGGFGFAEAATSPERSASVNEIGRAMLSVEKGGLILPFEAISLLLVAAMVGALTVARADAPPSNPGGDRR